MTCFSTSQEGLLRVFSFIENDLPQILDEEVRAYVSFVNDSQSYSTTTGSVCPPEVATGDQLYTSMVDNALRGVASCRILPAQPRFTMNGVEQVVFSHILSDSCL